MRTGCGALTRSESKKELLIQEKKQKIRKASSDKNLIKKTTIFFQHTAMKQWQTGTLSYSDML